METKETGLSETRTIVVSSNLVTIPPKSKRLGVTFPTTKGIKDLKEYPEQIRWFNKKSTIVKELEGFYEITIPFIYVAHVPKVYFEGVWVKSDGKVRRLGVIEQKPTPKVNKKGKKTGGVE